jgi:hypothetical protein
MRVRKVWLGCISITATFVVALSCSSGGGGGNGPSRSAGTGTVNVTLNDPATCAAPQGPYSHIYLTIADVRANSSATALPADSGWVDLTPNLNSAPAQVDLIGNSALQCSLPAIATGTQIAPAVFQKLNVTLLDNSSASKVLNNQCGAAANCVVLASNNSVQAIALSGESQNGISIPSAQISTGSFGVDVNQTKTLNLSVNSCASVVVQSNGALRLKPVMFAGEVGSSSTSMTGRIVDGLNLGTIPGGRVVVALEQKDSSGVDRVIQATVPDGVGAFSFCSLPSGSYDVVAIATNDLNVAYGATIATGVPAGTNLGNIPVYPQVGSNQAPAGISGQITTTGTSGGVSVDISVSVLQSTSTAGNTLVFTLPQVAPLAPTLSIATAANASCPVNTNCANYTLAVPVANPYIGSFAATGTTYVLGTGNAPYTLDALAYVPSSGNISDCTPSEVKTDTINVSAGTTSNVPALNFAACR